jgi:hypothetical protein
MHLYPSTHLGDKAFTIIVNQVSRNNIWDVLLMDLKLKFE